MLPRALLSGLLVLSLSAGVGFAASEGMKGHQGHGGHAKVPVLPEGQYSAKIAALVCVGCAPSVEKTLLDVPGIASAVVDSKTSRVDFAVKSGASVKWSELQKALKASADKMGMGADFTLSEFKIASAKGGDAPAEETPAGSKKHSGSGHHH